jgi:hypothetical protein
VRTKSSVIFSIPGETSSHLPEPAAWGVEPGKQRAASFLPATFTFRRLPMKKPAHNVTRFSAKAASRRRQIRFVIGFIIIAAMAVGSALILIVYEPIAVTLHRAGLPSVDPEPVKHRSAKQNAWGAGRDRKALTESQ